MQNHKAVGKSPRENASKTKRQWEGKNIPEKPEGISDRDWVIFTSHISQDITYQDIGEMFGVTREYVRQITDRVSDHILRKQGEDAHGIIIERNEEKDEAVTGIRGTLPTGTE